LSSSPGVFSERHPSALVTPLRKHDTTFSQP
jgi:hypothetical protein